MLSPFTDTSFLGPPAEGLYATRYWRTLPGAGSQETFMEDTVSSNTFRSVGEPLTEKRREKGQKTKPAIELESDDDDFFGFLLVCLRNFGFFQLVFYSQFLWLLLIINYNKIDPTIIY